MQNPSRAVTGKLCAQNSPRPWPRNPGASDAVQQKNLDLTPHVTLLAASNVLAIHGLNAAANDNGFLAGLRRFYRLRVSE